VYLPWRRRTGLTRTESGEPRDLVRERERELQFRDRLMSHAPALVSVGVFAFVALKIAIIARNNVSTARTLVSRVGPPST
jgi:hypothetical protein